MPRCEACDKEFSSDLMLKGHRDRDHVSEPKSGGHSAAAPIGRRDGYATSWQRAEALARDWLRANGFPDARLTSRGADAGVDVECEGIAAQVKDRSVPVGRPDVQKIAGVAQHLQRRAVFFSTSGYTREATDWASGAGVALYFLDPLGGEATPVNRIAYELHPPDLSKSLESRGSAASFQIDPSRTTREEQKRFKVYVRSTAPFGATMGLGGAIRSAFAQLGGQEAVRAAVGAQQRLTQVLLCVTTDRLLIASDRKVLSFPHGIVFALTFKGRKMSFVAEGERYKLTIQNSADSELVQAALRTGPAHY